MPVLWGRKGVPMFHHQAFQLYASMAARTPWSTRTHHPPTVTVGPRLLLRGSLSPSLPLSLPYPLPLSLLLSGPPPTAPHSLSLSQKGVFGMFGGSLSPPRGSNAPPQDRRDAVYPRSYDELFSVFIIVPTSPTPPCMSSPVRHIAVRMGVCSAACRGTAQRLRTPGPPASRAFSRTALRGQLGPLATHACSLHFCSQRRAPHGVPLPSDSGGLPPTGTGATCLHFWAATRPACSSRRESLGSS